MKPSNLEANRLSIAALVLVLDLTAIQSTVLNKKTIVASPLTNRAGFRTFVHALAVLVRGFISNLRFTLWNRFAFPDPARNSIQPVPGQNAI